MVELDAYYARLNRLSRDELRYVLDPQEVYGSAFPMRPLLMRDNSRPSEMMTGHGPLDRLIIDQVNLAADFVPNEFAVCKLTICSERIDVMRSQFIASSQEM